MTYLLTWLAIFLVSVPPAFAFWYAAKRGKSTRTTAPFFFAYFSLLSLAFFWIADVRGVALLIGMVLVVAFLLLAFYVYTEVADFGLTKRKK